jgi:hypothetical protein
MQCRKRRKPRAQKEKTRKLEDESGTLGLLVSTGREKKRQFVSKRYPESSPDKDDIPQLEMLASLQSQLSLGLARGTL